MPKGHPGRTEITKTCPVCGSQFKVIKGLKKLTCSKTCSYKLRGAKRQSRITKNCEVCGKAFTVKTCEAHAKYCSRRCMYTRNASRTTRNCQVCGKEFRTPPSHMHVKTCSVECGAKLKSQLYSKEKVKLTCWYCEREFYEHESHADRRVYCSKKCQYASEEWRMYISQAMTGPGNPMFRDATRISVSKTGKEYRRAAPHKENEKSVRRKRALLRATPEWRDHEKVLQIYKEARRLTRKTGIPHHVDHIVPLNSRLVCGLHNEFNLQILPATANLSKHNRHWPGKP